MLDSFFLVIAAKSLLDKISIKQNLKRKVIENGWNHPEWNKVRQEMLFDKYLWNVGSCPEQEFMTTWELYQYAQKELKDMGYVWNPAWNRYTPVKESVEYVRGTQIYNNLLNSEFHRYGEDLELQDDIFLSSLIGVDMYKNCLRCTQDGPTQYEKFLYLKTIYNNPNCNIYMFKENIKYQDHQMCNKYGEPFHWYDDLMPFTPSKTYIPYPSEKTFNDYRLKGIDLETMQIQMRKTVYNTKKQRMRVLQERNERMKKRYKK